MPRVPQGASGDRMPQVLRAWLVSHKPEACMTSHAIERELLELENQFWQAIKDKNADAVVRLSDGEFVELCSVLRPRARVRYQP